MSLTRFLVAIAACALLAGVVIGPAHAQAQAQTTAPPLTPAERTAMIAALQATGDPPQPGADDASLTADVLQYARTELGERIDPSAVDRFWALEPARRDLAADFQRARAADGLAAWLAGLSPPYPQYRALEAAAVAYRSFVRAGGWEPLPSGKTLRPGQHDPRAALLRARLNAEGYAVAEPADPTLFDGELKRALAQFQARHGIADNGLLDAQTRLALNVSAEDRLGQIEANLERWRWMPHQMPVDWIEVNIGFQTAALHHGARSILQMKVVVGQPTKRTPMFTSRIDSIVLNPPWNVPADIAAAELLPKGAAYLARNDFTWVDGHLQQRAGPKSALGRFKFDLPSPFGVYLHDTPVKSAFSRPVRLLSHGCMRLEKPQELAEILLERQGWTPEAIDEAVATGKTQRIPLKTTLPLYVVYWTAMVEPSGAVDFRPDAYGWDRKLIDALGGVKVAASPPPGSTDCTQARRPG